MAKTAKYPILCPTSAQTMTQVTAGTKSENCILAPSNEDMLIVQSFFPRSIVRPLNVRLSLFLILLFTLCSNTSQSQIQEITQELNRLPSLQDSIHVVNSLNRLGTLYRTRNADSCFYYGLEAKRLASNIHYRKGQTEADHVIAFALFKKGLYAESLELLGKILPQYQQLDDVEKIVRVYLDMVEVKNKGISDRAEIITLLQKAIKTGMTLEKDSIMSEVYLSYLNRGPTLSEDSITYYLSKSTEIANRYNDEPILAHNQLWEADLLVSNGQKEKALSLVQQSLSDAQRTGNTILEISSLMTLFNYEDDLQKKLEYLYQQYEVAQKSGDKYLEIYILNLALAIGNYLGDKDEIIDIYVELEKAMAAEWEKSKKFMGDYIKYNAIENDNKLLSQKNEQRTLWLIIITSKALIVVLAFYLVMIRRNRKAKEQIETLNDMTNMQIIAMEEAKYQAIKDEQQRLGQDLHDGLSASIASIRHQLEILSIDTDDTHLRSKLAKLQAEITNAYAIARNTSHEWFSTAEKQQEQSFEQRIKFLVDSALPDSRYQKNIHIDDGALWQVSTDTRITLFRIIQEAITNMIKHARAKHVEILIYAEKNSLILMVKDDGKGLDNQKLTRQKSTMGLQSIQRRVHYLTGEIDIRSEGKGTEITIVIPLLSS